MAAEPRDDGGRPPTGGAGGRPEPSPMLFLGAGLQFAAVTAALVLLGWWLDKKLDTAPWLIVTGLAIGVIGGTYKLWMTGKRFF